MGRRILIGLSSVPLLWFGYVLVRSSNGLDGWEIVGIGLFLGAASALAAVVVGPDQRAWRPLPSITGLAWIGLLGLLALVVVGLSSEQT
jgi:hypothetical protein